MSACGYSNDRGRNLITSRHIRWQYLLANLGRHPYHLVRDAAEPPVRGADSQRPAGACAQLQRVPAVRVELARPSLRHEELHWQFWRAALYLGARSIQNPECRATVRQTCSSVKTGLKSPM